MHYSVTPSLWKHRRGNNWSVSVALGSFSSTSFPTFFGYREPCPPSSQASRVLSIWGPITHCRDWWLESLPILAFTSLFGATLLLCFSPASPQVAMVFCCPFLWDESSLSVSPSLIIYLSSPLSEEPCLRKHNRQTDWWQGEGGTRDRIASRSEGQSGEGVKTPASLLSTVKVMKGVTSRRQG